MSIVVYTVPSGGDGTELAYNKCSRSKWENVCGFITCGEGVFCDHSGKAQCVEKEETSWIIPLKRRHAVSKYLTLWFSK